MEPLLYSPSWRKTPQSEWSTPARSTVGSLWKAGNSIAEIKRQTTIPRTTIKRWIEVKSSRTQRKGKSTRRRFVSKRQIRQIIRYIAKNWSTRRLSLEQVRAHLNIEASARTIRRELRRVGYRRCIACPRPFISRKQAKKRLDFAFSHRWWGTSDWAASREGGGDWRKVIWSDDCIFELGKTGRRLDYSKNR